MHFRLFKVVGVGVGVCDNEYRMSCGTELESDFEQ